MARRDVDLVIRARDEARGALTSINQALEKFVATQREVRDSAVGTDSALDRLGNAFADLRGMIGSGVGARITQEFERQAEAVTRLEREVRDAAAAQDRLTQEQSEAVQTTRRLASEQERAQAAVAQQEGVLRRASNEYQRLNRQLGRAPTEVQRFAREQARLREQLAKTEARLAGQEDKARRLRNELDAGIPATRRQAAAFARLGARLDRQNAVIANTESRLAGLGARLDGTVADADRFTAAVRRQNQARADTAQRVRGETQSLDRLKAGLAQANGALQTATENERRLGQEARNAEQNVGRLSQRLERAQSELEGTGAAAAQARVQLAGTARAARNALNAVRVREGSFGNLAALGQRVRALGAEIQRLGTEAGPELRRDFEIAKRAFREQIETARLVQKEVRNAGVGYAALGRAARSSESRIRGVENSMARLRGVTGQAQRTLKQTAREFDRTGRAARRAGVEAQRAGERIRQGTGGRQALTILQRIRSEVIALATAYVGLFGVFRGIGGVINALRTVQGAQSRLGALFDQDQTAVAEELEFIRRQADRLGIQFGVLSDAYTKFAIATQGTNIEGAETRRIFVRVAEAARVNNLTTIQLVATFRALEQIANKGVFQMEELRQQLGDRLPGAINILAAGLGVSTEVLSDLLERGEIGADRLADFADELEKRFGRQLPASLLLSEAAIGRFQNEIFETQRTIAEGSFQQGFIDLLNRLSETLGSDRFQSFAQGLSSALAFLANVVATLAENWRVLIIVGSAFVGLKLGPVLFAIAARFAAMTIQVRAATVGVSGLAGAFRALLSATGVGLIFTVVGASLAAWATSIDDATAALNDHEKTLDVLQNSWDELILKPEQYENRVSGLRGGAAEAGVTQVNVEAQLQALEEQRAQVLARIAAIIEGDASELGQEFRGLSQNVDDFLDQMIDLFARLDTGSITFNEFAAGVDNLYRQFEGDEDVRRAANRFLELARSGDDFAAKARELTLVLTVLTGKEEEAAEAADELLASETDLAKQREASIRQARSSLKEVTALESRAGTLAERYFQQVARGASQRDVQRTAGEWSQVVDQLELSRLRALEMFRAIFANLDPTNELLRTTRAEISDIIAELENAIALGEQDAARPFAEFFTKQVEFLRGEAQKILAEIGQRENLGLVPDFSAFERAQQFIDRAIERAQQAVAVLESIPQRTADVQAQIDDLNRFIATATAELRAYTIQVNENQISQLESLIATLEQQRQVARLSGQDSVANDLTAQLESARSELALLRVDTLRLLDAQEHLTVEAQEYSNQLREAQRGEATAGLRSDLADAQAQIQQLTELRDALRDIPVTSFSQFGDVAEDLEQVNTQLADAIDKALELARALAASDPAVAAVVAQLERLRAEAGRGATQIGISLQQISELAASGLARAFDEYAEAVANGEESTKRLGDAFRRFASDFLRQIAQMIIQQAILNALQGVGGSGGIFAGLFHSGGIAGGSAPSRSVPAYAFANAFRYQTGGFAGFAPGEVPAILHRGEEVLTSDDPRHAANGGGREGDVTVINAIDGPSFLDEALQERRGQQTVLNFIRSNRRSVRSALEI